MFATKGLGSHSSENLQATPIKKGLIMRIPVHALTAVATAILLHAGRNQAAAERVSSRLVSANVTGHDSHGVGMIPAYVDGIESGQLLPNAEIEIVNDKGPFLLIDGGRGFGHVIAEQAMEVVLIYLDQLVYLAQCFCRRVECICPSASPLDAVLSD